MAVLTYENRVFEIDRIEVAGETWVLSELPAATRKHFIASGVAGPDLDPLSGEVLLVEGETILSAVTMNEVPPSFISTEATAVFAGRIGDGGYPHSALVRIGVPEHEVDRVVFHQDVVDRYDLGPEWEVGTDEQYALFTAGRYEDVFR